MVSQYRSYLQHWNERFQNWLEPILPTREADERLTTRFLASLFLVIALFLIFVLPFRYLSLRNAEHMFVAMATSIISGLVLAFNYVLTRLGRHRLASVLVVIYGSVVLLVYSAVNSEGMHIRSLYYMTVLTLFASMFLSWSTTIMLGLIQVIGMLVLAQFVPELSLKSLLEGPVAFNMLLMFFLLMMATYRNRLDAARRSQLAEIAARYQSLVEEFNDVVYAISPDGTVVAINHAFEAIAGWRADEVIGQPFASFIHPDDLIAAREAFIKVLKGDTTQIFEMRTRTVREDYVALELRGTPHYVNGKLIGISGIARDITRRKQENAQQLHFALQRERLSSVTQFVQAISHDFRTALATIETSRYLIDRYVSISQTDRVHRKLDTIHHSVDHMTNQLENLHTVSALADLHLAPCDLNSLVQSVINVHFAKARANGQMIVFQPNQYLPSIMGDSSELYQAIKHLLLNALNFTPADGTITLRTSVSGERVLLEVMDTGIGISPEHQQEIFNLFYRADNARSLEFGGMGLGLTIVKLVAEAHGGDIQVESRPGRGSTFMLYIPVKHPAA